MNNQSKFDQFKSISSKDLAGAYDILHKSTLSQHERLSRPERMKVKRVMEILSGDVTPGCQSKEWFLFFEHLNKCLESGSVLP